ncbi:MAG TPA: alkaline phosphatase family protein [Bacteroidota bacterium]|nr:alkaline phosphatase family protein [Bacteroidota bacterium]
MLPPRHVLMLFLDGVGIGTKDPRVNPFFAAPMQSLRGLLGGAMPHLDDAHRGTPGVSLLPLDATLGVAGLPQSGTGQVALLTGENAAQRIGRHFGPYPYSTLKPLLKEANLFSKIEAAGKTAFYANAFPSVYFENVGDGKRPMTAIPLAWTMGGRALSNGKALASGAAISADLTNERWPMLGYPAMPALTPQQAGERLMAILQRYDFVLYEFSMTDHAGHGRSMESAVHVLELFDAFLEGLLSGYDGGSTTLVLTSDHGNLEDISTKSHTRNPVPLLVAGNAHRDFTAGAKAITDVAPLILKLLH